MYTRIEPETIKHMLEELERCEEKIQIEYEKLLEGQSYLKQLVKEDMWEFRSGFDRQMERLSCAMQRFTRYRMALECILDAYGRCEETILSYEDQKETYQMSYDRCDLRELGEKLLEYEIPFQ